MNGTQPEMSPATRLMAEQVSKRFNLPLDRVLEAAALWEQYKKNGGLDVEIGDNRTGRARTNRAGAERHKTGARKIDITIA
jgi:hypothetical protein